MRFFAHKNGKTIGPFSRQQILSEINLKRLSKDDLICLDGKNWISIKDSGIEDKSKNSIGFIKVVIISLFVLIFASISCLFFILHHRGYFTEENLTDSIESNDLDYFKWKSHPNDSFKFGASVVLFSKGKASFQEPESTSINKLGTSQILTEGTRITTESDGEAILLFSNGTSLSVGNNTNFLISGFGQKEFTSSDQSVGSIQDEISPSRIKLDLESGELVVVVKKLDKESSFTIESDLGFAGVRGTSFSINSKPNSISLNVLSGKVDFLDSGKRSKLVVEGEKVESNGKEPIIQKEISKSALTRVSEIERSVKLAVKDYQVFKLREYFDQLNPSLGKCDPIQKSKRFLSNGGTDGIAKSIDMGLDWLVSVQSEDGSWGEKDRDSNGNPKETNKLAMTGMSVLCLLENCEFDPVKNRGLSLRKGIQYLSSFPIENVKSQQAAYAHPIYTRAIINAFEKMKLKELEQPVNKAVTMIIDGQNVNGGWAYSYGKGMVAHVDLSVSGWNFMALFQAQSFGIRVNGLSESIRRAAEYVKKCQDKTGKFAYKIGSNGKPSLTGMGALCLQYGGEEYKNTVEKGLDWINKNISSDWNSIDFYGLRHASRACFYSQTFLNENKYWDIFKSTYPKILLENQKDNGSWPPAKHFHGDSNIFRTALALDVLLTFKQEK